MFDKNLQVNFPQAAVRRCVLAAAVVVLAAGFVAPLQAENAASAAFDRIKSLQGDWTAKMSDGATATTSFRVTAAGSVVVQMIGEGTEMEMPTMYHMDGDRLMVTHYCAARNQPRMVLEEGQDPSAGLKFRFLDATNLKSPEAGHMRTVAFEFLDANHIRQLWTYRENGKDKVEAFDLVRKQ